jgi:hypothetical protein
MRNLYLSAALLSGLAVMTGCNSVTTAADYAAMDAYADSQNRPGSRGAPTPAQMAAMGYFRTPEALAKAAGETPMAGTASTNQLANLRFIEK